MKDAMQPGSSWPFKPIRLRISFLAGSQDSGQYESSTHLYDRASCAQANNVTCANATERDLDFGGAIEF